MIENFEKLLIKLNKLDRTVKKTVKESIDKELKETVQADAKLLCSVNNGDLRESISERVEVSDDEIIGEVYTNSDHAAYVEFGTGPNGEMFHEGISPNAVITYKQKGWIIPADAMPESKAEEYGFKILRDKKGRVIGYGTKGQYAQPFLYPALKNNEEMIKNNIKQDIQNVLKEMER